MEEIKIKYQCYTCDKETEVETDLPYTPITRCGGCGEITVYITKIEGIENKTINDIWNIEDVQMRRPDLNDDQAYEVLLGVERRRDCNVGINWEFIDSVAENLFPEEEGSI